MNALILVDLQNDFLPGGALAVPEGDQVLPVLNSLLDAPFDFILATKDWHPAEHGSFALTHGKKVGEHILLEDVDQILWPVHCVQHSFGAEFGPNWDSDRVKQVFLKGTEKNVDSYSTFFDNGHFKSTQMDEFLRENNVDTVFIAGLATDYCVKYSVLDALKLGYQTYVIVDACRGVDLTPGDSERALAEMQKLGAQLITSKEARQRL